MDNEKKELKFSVYGGSQEMEEINNEAKEKPVILYKKYIGCYTKKGPIKRVRVKYDPNGKKKVNSGRIDPKTKEPIKKIVSNNGKGHKYEIVIEYGKEYTFNIADEKTKFMVDNLIRGGKIKEVVEGDNNA